MRTINVNTLLVGMMIAIAAIGFSVIVSVQAVYAQAATTSAMQDLNNLITTMTAIITTTAALAGGIIASVAKMSQKLGLVRDDEIQKMLVLAKELENSDQWSKEIEERLVAIGDIIAALPGGKDMLEQKRVDLKKWKDEASQLNGELSNIYKVLIPLLVKK
ncbi:MAG: hypothetical protein ACREAE_07100 [Nitrosopumilaceae archaeon]